MPNTFAKVGPESSREIRSMGGRSNKGRKPWNRNRGEGWLDSRDAVLAKVRADLAQTTNAGA